jgi:penicillin-binding protein 2
VNRWNVDSETRRAGRVRRMAALSAVLLAILVLRLFHLQVIATGGYLSLSRDNRFRERRILAPRGLILDRRGRVLAENQAACEATLAVRVPERNPEILPVLAGILGADSAALAGRCARGAEEGLPRVILHRDLSKEQILVLEERLPALPGLRLEDWARRSYPQGPLAAHLLGYVGEVDEDELAPAGLGPRRYLLGDDIGRAGVEKVYEPLLRGHDGKELFLVNARGAALETVELLPPSAGNRLYLTLDLTLTACLDSALAFWGAGAGVVMDARTGELLAAASRPAFDPNDLIGGIDPDLWRSLREDPARPLFNRVTQATYSPGSTFKPLVALAALEEGVVAENTLLRPCTGGLRLGRRFFRCWDPAGHGRLAVVQAIAQSCDVYFYQVGDQLGIDRMARVARRFGLGAVCGLDLAAEARGLVPDSQWYDRRFGRGKWTSGNVWNVAIGQGELLVSCLQMARVYAALGNGGFLPVPRLRHHVEDEHGEVLIPFSPSRGERARADAAALRLVRAGLEEVLHGEDGTARGSQLASMRTAGKTGTVQNPHGPEHAWFCGYAPADEPEIAIALIVEHGEHGSDIAPIFRELVNVWFALGETPLRRGPRPAADAPEATP